MPMRMEFGKILQMLRILQLCLCALLLCESLSAATNDVIRSARKLSLAVELHDSMSQNLTGATMQIDTAQKLIEKNREKAHS